MISGLTCVDHKMYIYLSEREYAKMRKHGAEKVYSNMQKGG